MKLWPAVPALLVLGVQCSPRSAAPTAAPTPAMPAIPAPTPIVVGEGEAIETAVLVPAETEAEGVSWENEWIWRRFGRFRKKGVGLATLAGRRYDVVTIELPDHSEATVFFDVTRFLGKK
jgi:hypothetical protein